MLACKSGDANQHSEKPLGKEVLKLAWTWGFWVARFLRGLLGQGRGWLKESVRNPCQLAEQKPRRFGWDSQWEFVLESMLQNQIHQELPPEFPLRLLVPSLCSKFRTERLLEVPSAYGKKGMMNKMFWANKNPWMTCTRSRIHSRSPLRSRSRSSGTGGIAVAVVAVVVAAILVVVTVAAVVVPLNPGVDARIFQVSLSYIYVSDTGK